MPWYLVVILLLAAALSIGVGIFSVKLSLRQGLDQREIMVALLVSAPGFGMVGGFLMAWFGS